MLLTLSAMDRAKSVPKNIRNNSLIEGRHLIIFQSRPRVAPGSRRLKAMIARATSSSPVAADGRARPFICP